MLTSERISSTHGCRSAHPEGETRQRPEPTRPCREGTDVASHAVGVRTRPEVSQLEVAERIVEAAGYHLDLVTEVHFTQHTAPTVRAFWVPDRLWRGKLPECFSKVYLDDEIRFRGVAKFDLRRRPQRRRFYELLLRRGKPAELMDWIDGALLVDLWDELKIPEAIRRAWQPAVSLASNGPPARPWYGPMV